MTSCEFCLYGRKPDILGNELCYRVASSSDVGRHLVAARDLSAGEIVFKASPLAVGLQTGSIPLCLGCYRPVDGSFLCPSCGWPLCSEECVLSLQHQPECEVTSRTGMRVQIQDVTQPDPLYDCITIIRCLMLKKQAPALWEQLMSMESHTEKRKQSTPHQRRSLLLSSLLHSRFSLSDFTDDEICKVIGILEVNAYEIRMPITNVEGVYAVACLPEHSCVPNTFRTFERDLSLIIRAAVDIPAGEHITITYTDTLWSTTDRRAHLFFSKHFLCYCDRCQDPSELGSWLGALHCSSCDDGYLLPVDPLATDWVGDLEMFGTSRQQQRQPEEDNEPEEQENPSASLQVEESNEDEEEDAEERDENGGSESDSEREDSIWLCTNCPNLESGRVVRSISQRAAAAVRELDESEAAMEQYELVLCQYSPVLHPHHAQLVDIKHTLLHLYRIKYLDTALLPRKEELCRDILDVTEKLFPGISQLKGTTLFELGSTVYEIVRRQSENAANTCDFIPKLQEAEQYFNECIYHLQYQPESQPEYIITEKAHNQLHSIRSWLQSLKAAVSEDGKGMKNSSPQTITAS